MISNQVAAIPYEVGPKGQVRVLLVTSKRRGRWVLPKGKVKRWMAPHVAAAREAFEEAGVVGDIDRVAIGTYRQRKEALLTPSVDVLVRAYPLAVTDQLNSWPERFFRRRSWFELAEAQEAVRNSELKKILRAFAAHLQEHRGGAGAVRTAA
jgi:8-oxo-dGTP pyrophosphatase MutT (NUDIX family)